MKQILVFEPGGPEQMVLADVPVPAVPAGHVLVAIHVAGVNFLDVYFRTGLYKSDHPIAIGSEAAGVVEAIGEGVNGFARGDRVAYAMVRGTYAEYAVVPAANLVKVPDALTFERAAAVLLQGATAHYLTRSTFPLDGTHTCLVHAAAGGAGGLVVQMARGAGARVIGTVSTAQKAREATELGADEVINYTEQDFEQEVKRLTGGAGVHVVYDSVGKTTFDKSLKVLRPRGMMVLFGQSSGAVAPVESADAQCRLAVPHPPDPGALHPAAGRTAVARGRGVRHGRPRRAQGAHLGDLPARRRRAGASRHRGAARRTASCCSRFAERACPPATAGLHSATAFEPGSCRMSEPASGSHGIVESTDGAVRLPANAYTPLAPGEALPADRAGVGRAAGGHVALGRLGRAARASSSPSRRRTRA